MDVGSVHRIPSECTLRAEVGWKLYAEPHLDPSIYVTDDLVQWVFALFLHIPDICRVKLVSKTWCRLITTCDPLWKRRFLKRYDPPPHPPRHSLSGFWHERYICKRLFEHNFKKNRFTEPMRGGLPCRFLPHSFSIDSQHLYTLKEGHLYTYDLATGRLTAMRSIVVGHGTVQDVKICEIRGKLGIFEHHSILDEGTSHYTLYGISLENGRTAWQGKQNERYFLPAASAPQELPSTFPVYTRQNFEDGSVAIRSRDPYRGQILAENIIKKSRNEALIPKISCDGETLVVYTKRNTLSSHPHYLISGASVQKVALKSFDAASGAYCVEHREHDSPTLLSIFPQKVGVWLMKRDEPIVGVALTAHLATVVFKKNRFMIVNTDTGTTQCEKEYLQNKEISAFRLFDDKLLITHKTRPPTTLAFDVKTGMRVKRFSKLSCRWIIGREDNILISFLPPYLGFWNIHTGKCLLKRKEEKGVNRIIYQSGCLFVFSRSEEEGVRVRVRDFRPLSIMPRNTASQEPAKK